MRSHFKILTKMNSFITPREAVKKPELTKTTFCEEGRSIRAANLGYHYQLFPECFFPTDCKKIRLAQVPSWLLAISILLLTISPAWCQTQPETKPSPGANDLDLSPEIIDNSPVLQRWRREIPNVLEDIRNDPSFRTRLRLGYSQFPSTGQAAGFNVGVEDVFIGRTGFTVSGDYQGSFNGDRKAYGADLRYYVLPLGSYVNIAPVVGYRNLETDKYSTDGVNVGAKLMLALSRTGAADVSLTQTFVSPGSSEEVGLTTLSVGYAVTRNLRLSTDIQQQNSTQRKDSRVGVVLEWMP